MNKVFITFQLNLGKAGITCTSPAFSKSFFFKMIKMTKLCKCFWEGKIFYYFVYCQFINDTFTGL